MQRSLRRDFRLIRDQCLEIIACNDLYSGLFDAAENLDLINRTAPQFFSEVQSMLYDQWILRAYKLGDVANASRRDTRRHNISIRNLDRSLKRARLRNVAVIRASSGILRYWRLIRATRNKIVAHADRRTYRSQRRLGQHAAGEVTAFLESIQEYCDAVGKAVLAWPGELKSLAEGDAGELLGYLRSGWQAEEGTTSTR